MPLNEVEKTSIRRQERRVSLRLANFETEIWKTSSVAGECLMAANALEMKKRSCVVENLTVEGWWMMNTWRSQPCHNAKVWRTFICLPMRLTNYLVIVTNGSAFIYHLSSPRGIIPIQLQTHLPHKQSALPIPTFQGNRSKVQRNWSVSAQPRRLPRSYLSRLGRSRNGTNPSSPLWGGSRVTLAWHIPMDSTFLCESGVKAAQLVAWSTFLYI